ncbi:MAG: hypothetical protein KAY32_08220 [Candidatus Eisenbacteria sp.]|nr:hypothetical protein [Candidatus Eisenbacteria bacterium]
MSTVRHFFGMIALVLSCLASPTQAQDALPDDSRNPNYFALGAGLLVGSGFHDALVDAYSEDYNISGGGGFFDMQAGFGISVDRHFYILPRLRLLGCPIAIKGYSGFPPSKDAAIILMPGVYGRYAVSEEMPSFYADAGISLVSPSCDLNRISCESGGLALGAALGYAHGSHEFEISYTKIPIDLVDSEYDYDYGASSATKETDWGGVSFTYRRRWTFD